MDKMY